MNNNEIIFEAGDYVTVISSEKAKQTFFDESYLADGSNKIEYSGLMLENFCTHCSVLKDPNLNLGDWDFKHENRWKSLSEDKMTILSWPTNVENLLFGYTLEILRKRTKKLDVFTGVVKNVKKDWRLVLNTGLILPLNEELWETTSKAPYLNPVGSLAIK